MKTLINLTKIYFKETITSFLGKSKSAKTKSSLLFFVLFAIIAAALGFEYYVMAEAFEPLGLATSIIPMGLLTTSLVLIVTNSKSFGENFYKTKDYESLQALPIKSFYVILAKYLSSMLVSIIFTIACLVPAFVVYFIFFEATFTKVLFCLISILFLPAFSQFLGCIISWISNLISSRMKNKNIMSGIIGLIFVTLLVAVMSMLGSESMARLLVNDFPLWLKIIMPFTYFLSGAILQQNILYFLAFVGICIVYSLAAAALVLVGYKKINSNFKTTAKAKLKKPLNFEKHTVFSQFVKKELKTLLSTPIYFMNSIVGPLLAVVMPFAMFGLASELSLLGENLPVVLVGVLPILMLGMAPTSCVSISLEGQNIKTIKSMPISHNCFLWSKIMFNIFLNLPFLLISQTLMIVFLKIDILSAVLVVLLGLVLLFFISLSSLFINLLLPKLEWTSAAHVVKQSASVLLSMLLNMVISILIIVFAATVLPPEFSIKLYLIIVFAFFVLFGVVLTIIFNKKSKTLYQKLC